MYQASQGRHITAWIDDLAPTIGRLIRRVEGSANDAAQDIATRVENLDAMTYPDAHALYTTFRQMGDDEKVGIAAALDIVDRRATTLRRTMGLDDK